MCVCVCVCVWAGEGGSGVWWDGGVPVCLCAWGGVFVVLLSMGRGRDAFNYQRGSLFYKRKWPGSFGNGVTLLLYTGGIIHLLIYEEFRFMNRTEQRELLYHKCKQTRDLPAKYQDHRNYYMSLSSGDARTITKTYLYNFDPLKPHFYIVKLGFIGVYIIFIISAQRHRLWVLVRTASPRRF